jgi:hypothetical protein
VYRFGPNAHGWRLRGMIFLTNEDKSAPSYDYSESQPCLFTGYAEAHAPTGYLESAGPQYNELFCQPNDDLHIQAPGHEDELDGDSNLSGNDM